MQTWSWDDAKYLGDAEDGCYYGAVENPDGTFTAITDVDCTHFCSTICNEPGFTTAEAAEQAARSAAFEWCCDNRVATEEG